MRRRKAERREIQPDSRYNSVQVQSLINRVLKNGKKSLATQLVYDAFDIIGEKTGKDPLEIFNKAVENTSPRMEVRPRRIGGATYQIPMEVPAYRQFALSARWMLASVRAQTGSSFKERLAAELMKAAKNEGSAVNKKEESHRMAKANRAFSHFRY
ncbi:MAG: 30S ribosomal protein S7 [Chloroflexota bacterium]|nr:MAG: 30S ribosomal protein S7 [Anaerolineaceae bacterium 4572_5.2]RLD04836.1 MAG: 30S ribosomal protein S7 [Chloroflexota bacterium]